MKQLFIEIRAIDAEENAAFCPAGIAMTKKQEFF